MVVVFCLFKQKTAYEMRISDWSSDVCSSDLRPRESLQVAKAQDSALVDFCDEPGCAFGECARVRRPEENGRLVSCRACIFAPRHHLEIGRASCRDRVCQYV